MSLLRMNRLVRTAVRFVNRLRLVLNEEGFELAIFSAISWFKVVERYSRTGEVSGFKRRDFRGGEGRRGWGGGCVCMCLRATRGRLTHALLLLD